MKRDVHPKKLMLKLMSLVRKRRLLRRKRRRKIRKGKRRDATAPAVRLTVVIAKMMGGGKLTGEGIKKRGMAGRGAKTKSEIVVARIRKEVLRID